RNVWRRNSPMGSGRGLSDIANPIPPKPRTCTAKPRNPSPDKIASTAPASEFTLQPTPPSSSDHAIELLPTALRERARKLPTKVERTRQLREGWALHTEVMSLVLCVAVVGLWVPPS